MAKSKEWLHENIKWNGVVGRLLPFLLWLGNWTIASRCRRTRTRTSRVPSMRNSSVKKKMSIKYWNRNCYLQLLVFIIISIISYRYRLMRELIQFHWRMQKELQLFTYLRPQACAVLSTWHVSGAVMLWCICGIYLLIILNTEFSIWV